ncbi:MAG: sarcosine oxidase subunit gamma family protein [Sphingomonas sp.]
MRRHRASCRGRQRRACAAPRGGPGARDLIAQGCSIDLHPRAFAPGHSAVTLIAQIGVAIDQIDADGFRLITDRSYTPYLRTWLAHALAG